MQEYFGGLVNLVFEDNAGEDVTVDADVGWKSLVALVQVSWPCFLVRLRR